MAYNEKNSSYLASFCGGAGVAASVAYVAGAGGAAGGGTVSASRVAAVINVPVAEAAGESCAVCGG